MRTSQEAEKLKQAIEKAIDDHKITRLEMEKIIITATADSYIDPQEQALLNQLLEMIDNKTIKIVP